MTESILADASSPRTPEVRQLPQQTSSKPEAPDLYHFQPLRIAHFQRVSVRVLCVLCYVPLKPCPRNPAPETPTQEPYCKLGTGYWYCTVAWLLSETWCAARLPGLGLAPFDAAAVLLAEPNVGCKLLYGQLQRRSAGPPRRCTVRGGRVRAVVCWGDT